MKKLIHILTVAGALMVTLAMVGAGSAADVAAGKKLVEEKCVGCHKAEKYNDPGRKVTSLEALTKQVAACATAAKLMWTDAQKADVTAHLNKEYYKIK